VLEFRAAFLIGFLSALFAPLVSSVAVAQPNGAAAEALFRAGRVAALNDDPQTACSKFRESYRLDAALGTLLNIAFCEESLGELSNAWQHLQDVVHGLPAGDERVALAQQHLRELDVRLPRLVVSRAATAPTDTRVLLEEVELGAASFDVELPLDPGEHTVRARANGRLERKYVLTIKLGDRVKLEVEPGDAAPPTLAVTPVPATTNEAVTVAPAQTQSAHDEPPASRPAQPDHHVRRTLAYVLLGTGGASLIASGVFTFLVLDRKEVVDEHCESGSKACDPKGSAAVDSGKTYFAMTFVTLGIALASAGVGAGLLLTEPDDDERLSLTPMLTPTAAYAQLSGSF
jgi:hypothetical protein